MLMYLQRVCSLGDIINLSGVTRSKKRAAEPIAEAPTKRPTIAKEVKDTRSELEKKKEELQYFHYGFKLI